MMSTFLTIAASFAAQPDLASTRQTLSYLQTPQYQHDWGESVAVIGDVDGDGFTDLAVGSPTVAGLELGRTYLYSGSVVGVTQGSEWVSNGCCRSYGTIVAGAGDLDGDGFGDVLTTAPDTNDAPPAVMVQYGSAVGVDQARTVSVRASVGLPTSEFDDFAGSLAGGVDVNGDGFSDLVVGRAEYDSSAAVFTGGEILQYLGSAGGIDPSTESAFREPAGATSLRFPQWLEPLGDVNADGFDDVGASLRLGGSLYIYFGSVDGLQATHLQTLEPPVGSEGSFAAGELFAGVGDLDADGFDDVAVIAPGHARAAPPAGAPTHGAVLVYFGSPTGLEPDPGWVIEPPVATDLQGALAGAGDIDGDGHADLVAGSRTDGDVWNTSATVHYGAPRATGSVRYERLVDPTAQGDSFFGVETLSAGDLNGDGYSDLAIGDSLYGTARGGRYTYQPGAVFLYYGGPPVQSTQTGHTGSVGSTGHTGLSGHTGSGSTTHSADTGTRPSTTDTGTGRVTDPSPESVGGDGGERRCGCTSTAGSMGFGLWWLGLVLGWRRARGDVSL